MADLKQRGTGEYIPDIGKYDIPEEGRYAPCCHFDEHIKLEEYESKTKEYFSRLMNGERIPQCKSCWKVEDMGLPSLRIHELDWKPSSELDGIRKLDIRIHNKCNLACTMCFSGASNLWGKLEGSDTFSKISDDELQFLKNTASNVERISFQGGEPFYGSEYDDFLMSLQNKSDIVVDVFTNLISAKPNVIQRWNDELKQLRVNASVDGYGEVYDSIRWPSTWAKWEKNAKAIYNIVGSNMTYFWVYQAENVCNLFEFIKWRDKNTPDCKILINRLANEPESDLGLDTITQYDKDIFLALYDNYKKIKYDSKYYASEIYMIDFIKNYIYKTIPSDGKIKKRLSKLKHINFLRKSYTNK